MLMYLCGVCDGCAYTCMCICAACAYGICGICAGSVVYAHMLNMSWICMHVHMYECA